MPNTIDAKAANELVACVRFTCHDFTLEAGASLAAAPDRAPFRDSDWIADQVRFGRLAERPAGEQLFDGDAAEPESEPEAAGADAGAAAAEPEGTQASDEPTPQEPDTAPKRRRNR